MSENKKKIFYFWLCAILFAVLVACGDKNSKPATNPGVLHTATTGESEKAEQDVKSDPTKGAETTPTGEEEVTPTTEVTDEAEPSPTVELTATPTKAVTPKPTATSTPVPVATKFPTLAPTKAATATPTTAPTSTPSPTPAYQEGYKWEYDMLDCVNAERAKEGLKPYTWSDDLAVIAQRRLGEAMAVWGTGQEHAGCVTGGENLASTGGYRLPSQVMEGWLISEGHRSVIMGDVTEDIILPDDYPYTMVVDGVEYTAGDTVSGTPVRMACVSFTSGATGAQFWIMVVEWR